MKQTTGCCWLSNKKNCRHCATQEQARHIVRTVARWRFSDWKDIGKALGLTRCVWAFGALAGITAIHDEAKKQGLFTNSVERQLYRVLSVHRLLRV